MYCAFVLTYTYVVCLHIIYMVYIYIYIVSSSIIRENNNCLRLKGFIYNIWSGIVEKP